MKELDVMKLRAAIAMSKKHWEKCAGQYKRVATSQSLPETFDHSTYAYIFCLTFFEGIRTAQECNDPSDDPAYYNEETICTSFIISGLTHAAEEKVPFTKFEKVLASRFADVEGLTAALIVSQKFISLMDKMRSQSSDDDIKPENN